MLQKESRFIFLIVFAILGIALAMQFRTIYMANRQKAQTVYQQEELNTLLAQEKQTGNDLRAQIDENQKEKDVYVKTIFDSKNDDASKKQQDYLESVKLKAGLTDVKGPGITIVMSDAPLRPVDNPNELLIHDSDIFKVLNELKKAGAQAISINDERIIATSEQVCAGPTIRINSSRYAAPFTIKAVGNPDALYDGLSSSGIVALMLGDNIGVKINKSKEVSIPKYHYNTDNLVTGLEVNQK